MKEIYNVGVCGFNSYLIIDEKTVLIDTVPEKYSQEFFENINKYTKKIDFVIFNRTTPDATGCVCELLKCYPYINVIASVAGLRNLKEIINLQFNEMVAKSGAELNTGKNSISFIMTPNLSWPDTMVTYIAEQGVLFSGCLFCENSETKYFNKEALKTALSNINALSPKLILPAYGEFLEQKEDYENREAFGIIYSSEYGNTKEMAYEVERAARDAGMDVIIVEARNATDDFFEKCSSFAIGTPTYNHNAAADVLSAISGINVIRNMGKPAFVFGSYGWSGEGVDIVAGLLKNLKIKVYNKPFKSIFKLSDEVKNELYDKIKEFIGENKNA